MFLLSALFALPFAFGNFCHTVKSEVFSFLYANKTKMRKCLFIMVIKIFLIILNQRACVWLMGLFGRLHLMTNWKSTKQILLSG